MAEKKILVRVKKPFQDYEADVIRDIGEEFQVTEKRYAELVANLPDGFITKGEEENAAVTEDEVGTVTKKRRTTKTTKKGE